MFSAMIIASVVNGASLILILGIAAMCIGWRRLTETKVGKHWKMMVAIGLLRECGALDWHPNIDKLLWIAYAIIASD